MRKLIICLAAFLSACAHAGGEAFKPGQVWSLAVPSASDARVIIGRVEPRRDRTVVHASIVGLSAPPRAAEALERFHLFYSPHKPRAGEEPITGFMFAGMHDDDGEWYGGAVLLDVSPRPQNGAVAIPHVAVYESHLRAAVSELVGNDLAPVDSFEIHYDLWRQGESSWPELNDRDLDRPLRVSVAIAEATLASELSAFLIPVPPAKPGADESAFRDGEVDKHCRDRATIIVKQHNEDVGATILTRSENWGLVWRADRRDHSSNGQTVDRLICWLADGGEESHLAFYWNVPPLISTDVK